MDASMDDISLLKDYVDRQDQQAFAQVVGRHGGWMYSTARRELRDEHLAEDVTQAVFAMLSKRAGRLRRYGYISGWLFLALGYCIKETKRRRMQQTKGEKEVASMRREAVEAKWDDVAPELDAAVRKLGKSDREALLLRFYEQRPLAEVGNALGISEEAARMRVQRAVEKLRGILGKKGVTGTTAGLSAVLVGNVVGQMPEGLVEKIVSTVGSGGGSTLVAAIARGAMNMMAMAKVKVAAVMLAGALLVSGGAIVLSGQMASGPTPATSAMHASTLPTEVLSLLASATRASQWIEWSSFQTETKTTDTTLPDTTPFVVKARQYRMSDGRSHILTDYPSGAHREDIAMKDAHYFWVTTGPGTGLVQIAHTPASLTQHRLADRAFEYAGGFLDGVVYDRATGNGPGMSLLDLAASGTSGGTVEATEQAGEKCYRVTMSTTQGRLELWISPSHGNNVIRYELVRAPNPETGGALHVICEATEFTKVGNTTLISAGRVETTWTDGHGIKASRQTVAKRSDIVLKPELNDPLLFSTRGIPNGLRVVDEDAPDAVEMIWQDGRPMQKNE